MELKRPVRFEFLGPLSWLVKGKEEVEAGSVAEAAQVVDRRLAGLQGRLLKETGRRHRHISSSVNEEDIRFQDELETTFEAGALVAVLSAIAGG